MLDKIDLGNSRTLTILIIVVLILFAIIYVCVNRDGFENEGFTNYQVLSSDIVQLQGGLDNVQVGSSNTPLTTSINTIIQQALSNLIPALTVVSYFGTTAPVGWQLCDGKPLKDTNGNVLIGSDGNVFSTPNLQGRVIVGTTTGSNSQPSLKDQNGLNLAIYNVGHYSGEENHKLTIAEMPSHSHPVNVSAQGDNCGGGCPAFGTTTFSKLTEKRNGVIWQAYASTMGGDTAHNNMQPYYTLTYIIKQPQSGANIQVSNSNSPLV